MRKAPEDLMMADISKDGELMSTAPTGFGMIDLQGVIKKVGRDRIQWRNDHRIFRR